VTAGGVVRMWHFCDIRRRPLLGSKRSYQPGRVPLPRSITGHSANGRTRFVELEMSAVIAAGTNAKRRSASAPHPEFAAIVQHPLRKRSEVAPSGEQKKIS
jgi:hypothetical protein